MYHIQEIIQKIKRASKRRKKLLFFIPIFFIGLSVAALYIIEPTYESSTTVLVDPQGDAELSIYNAGDNAPQQNQLRSLENIVLSRSTMEMVIDSLGMGDSLETMSDRQSLIEGLRASVEISSEPNNAFEITVSSKDPVQARDMAQMLADHFINTRERLESRRTSETVEYLEGKLEELTSMVNNQREDLVNQRTQQMEEVAEDPEVLQRSLENTNEQIQEVDLQMQQIESRLRIIDQFLDQDSQNITVQPLHRLSLEEVPNGEELQTLLSEYDTLNQRYTEEYPQLRNTRSQIVEVTQRIRPAVENNLEELQSQRADLEEKRNEVMNNMEVAYVANERNNSNRSTFSIYEELAASIQQNLEQARINQELESQATTEFEVLDQAYVPEEPASPNKRMILGAGLGLGLLLSCLLAGFAEMLDTTVRYEEDLKLKKPVIAYLKDGRQ